jgi:hypothetical protein
MSVETGIGHNAVHQDLQNSDSSEDRQERRHLNAEQGYI